MPASSPQPRRPVVRPARALRAAAPLAALVTLVPAGAAAQLRGGWDAQVGAARTQPDVAGAAAPSWTEQRALGALLRFDAPRGHASVGGALGGTGGRWQGAADLAALVTTPSWRGVRAGVGASGRVGGESRTDAASLLGTWPIGAADATRLAVPGASFAAADAHLSLRRGSGGAWLGGDLLRERAAERTARGARVLGLLAGAWRQLRGVTLSVQAAARRATADALAPGGGSPDGLATGDTLVPFSPVTTPGDSGTSRALRRWAEGEARIGWARGRVALDGVVGARPRTADIPAAVWAHGNGVVGIAPGLAVVARAGALPYTPTSAGSRRFVALGVRLAPPALWRPPTPAPVRPVASRFAVRPLGGGTYAVTLRVPGASVVELSGDFTGWQPVAMRQVDLDTWELVTRIVPGPHRCNVRVDGDAWTPPPGTTAVDDDFNGRVGLIVIE